MKKKFLVLSLAFMLVFSVTLAGCSGNGKGDSASNDDPIADGTLSVAVDDTYLPMEFRDDQNNLVGFDVDLAKAIGEGLGVKVDFTTVAWDGIFNGLTSNQYEMIIAGTSITEERQKTFNMSSPYTANGIVIVSRNDGTPAKTADDLKGKKVGVQIETTSDYAAEKMIENGTDMNLSKFDAMLDAFTALEGKTIDYILTDKPVGQFYTSKKPDVYSITSETLSNEPIGITMRKNDTEFAQKIEETLQKLRDNGKLAELSQKWFGEDITENINTELKDY